jgi:hypothetical protein
MLRRLAMSIGVAALIIGTAYASVCNYLADITCATTQNGNTPATTGCKRSLLGNFCGDCDIVGECTTAVIIEANVHDCKTNVAGKVSATLTGGPYCVFDCEWGGTFGMQSGRCMTTRSFCVQRRYQIPKSSSASCCGS